jgi:hypothetical protein
LAKTPWFAEAFFLPDRACFFMVGKHQTGARFHDTHGPFRIPKTCHPEAGFRLSF